MISSARVFFNSRISNFDVQTVLGRQVMLSQTRACSLDLGCPSQLTSEMGGALILGTPGQRHRASLALAATR